MSKLSSVQSKGNPVDYNQVISKDIIEQAAWSIRNLSGVIYQAHSDVNTSMMSSGTKAGQIIPQLHSVFTHQVPYSSKYAPSFNTVVTAVQIFSARGPLACRLKEQIAIDEILDVSSYKLDALGSVECRSKNIIKRQAQLDKVKTLFDFSSFFIPEKDRFFTSNGTLKRSMSLLISKFNIREPFVSKKSENHKIDIQILDNHYQYSSNNSKQIIEFHISSMEGILFKYNADKSDFHYFHPNENMEVNNGCHALFNGDKEKLLSLAEEFFNEYGFRYKNYDNEERYECIVFLDDLISLVKQLGTSQTDPYFQCTEITYSNSNNLNINYSTSLEDSETKFNSLVIEYKFNNSEYGTLSFIGSNQNIEISFRISSKFDSFGRNPEDDPIKFQLDFRECVTAVINLILTPEEQALVKHTNGQQIDNIQEIINDETVSNRPIKFGLIRTVEKNKWMPNSKKYQEFFINPDETTIPPR